MNKYQYGGGEAFRGPAYQRGYGLGGSFRRFFKWLVPLVSPTIKDLGRTAIGHVGDFAKDVAAGADLKESAARHINTAVNSLKDRVEKKLRGEGKRNIKRKKILIKKKSYNDIFAQ
jgi:hypothetical protein